MLKSFVIQAGFEPTTHSLEGCCSLPAGRQACLPTGRYPAELRGLNRAAKLEKIKLLPRIAAIAENPNFVTRNGKGCLKYL